MSTKLITKNMFKEMKARSREIRGMFLGYKEADVSVQDSAMLLRLQLNDEIRVSKGPSLETTGLLNVHVGPFLPYTCSGLLVFGIGNKYKKFGEYLNYHNSTYNLNIELGTATDTHTAFGNVVEQSPYEHVTEDMFANALTETLGTICLKFSPYYKQDKYTLFKDMNEKDLVLKYPDTERVAEIKSARLLEFKLPYVRFECVVNGPFSPSGFAHKLCKDLKTCCHVKKMSRTHYGPFKSSDALPSYRWTFSYIKDMIEKQQEAFKLLVADNYKRFPNITEDLAKKNTSKLKRNEPRIKYSSLENDLMKI